MILSASRSLRQSLWDHLSGWGMDWMASLPATDTPPLRTPPYDQLYRPHEVAARKRRAHE